MKAIIISKAMSRYLPSYHNDVETIIPTVFLDSSIQNDKGIYQLTLECHWSIYPQKISQYIYDFKILRKDLAKGLTTIFILNCEPNYLHNNLPPIKGKYTHQGVKRTAYFWAKQLDIPVRVFVEWSALEIIPFTKIM